MTAMDGLYPRILTLVAACSLLCYKVSAYTSTEWYRCPLNLARNGYLRTYNEHCYEFIDNEAFWGVARTACQNKGGHLIEIRDSSTQAFVESSLRDLNWAARRNGLWIGASDVANEETWRWVSGDVLTWGNWASGQPEWCFFPCIEDCANLRLDDNYKWHDKPCDSFNYHYTYICQYDMGPVSTTTTTITTTTTTPTTTTTTPTTTTTTPTTTTTTPTTTTTTPTTTTTTPTTTTNTPTTTTTTPTTTTTTPTTTTTTPTTTTTTPTTTTTTPTTTTTTPTTTTTTTATPTTTSTTSRGGAWTGGPGVAQGQVSDTFDIDALIGLIAGLLVAVCILLALVGFLLMRRCKSANKKRDSIRNGFDNVGYSVSSDHVSISQRAQRTDARAAENDYVTASDVPTSQNHVRNVYDNTHYDLPRKINISQVNSGKTFSKSDYLDLLPDLQVDLCSKKGACGGDYDTLNTSYEDDDDDSVFKDAVDQYYVEVPDVQKPINDTNASTMTSQKSSHYDDIDMSRENTMNSETENYLRAYDPDHLAKSPIEFLNNLQDKK